MLVRQWKGSRLSVAMISSLAELPRIAPHQDIKNTKGYNFKAMLVAEVDSELSVQSHHVTPPPQIQRMGALLGALGALVVHLQYPASVARRSVRLEIHPHRVHLFPQNPDLIRGGGLHL